MADRLQHARDSWLRERHRYEAFGKLLAGTLLEAINHGGIAAEVASRAKTMDSLVKKLIRKPEHSYESLGDKVGLRVVVRYRPDVEGVLAILDGAFECSGLEDTAGRLGTEKVGYRSWHVIVGLRPSDPNRPDFEGLAAEVQVRTLAQHLWSEMAHDLVYKNEAKLPDDLVRRMNLLAGLIEMADDEFSRLDREISGLPEMGVYTVLRELERQYLRLVSSEWDRELSFDVVQLLLPLYGGESPDGVAERLRNRCTTDSADIQDALRREQVSAHERSVFMLQPEVLMIYDRLRTDRYSLRDRWSERYPEEELERVANAFGYAL